MLSPELIACIPVDRDVALGAIPKVMANAGVHAVSESARQVHGRVVRSDLGWADDAANATNKTVERSSRACDEG
jgi:hypothetical protein